MREFAEVYLELMKAIKQLHKFVLSQKDVEAYLTSCDVTELAQELEDVLQDKLNKTKQ